MCVHSVCAIQHVMNRNKYISYIVCVFETDIWVCMSSWIMHPHHMRMTCDIDDVPASVLESRFAFMKGTAFQRYSLSCPAPLCPVFNVSYSNEQSFRYPVRIRSLVIFFSPQTNFSNAKTEGLPPMATTMNPSRGEKNGAKTRRKWDFFRNEWPKQNLWICHANGYRIETLNLLPSFWNARDRPTFHANGQTQTMGHSKCANWNKKTSLLFIQQSFFASRVVGCCCWCRCAYFVSTQRCRCIAVYMDFEVSIAELWLQSRSPCLLYLLDGCYR